MDTNAIPDRIKIGQDADESRHYFYTTFPMSANQYAIHRDEDTKALGPTGAIMHSKLKRFFAGNIFFWIKPYSIEVRIDGAVTWEEVDTKVVGVIQELFGKDIPVVRDEFRRALCVLRNRVIRPIIPILYK